MDLFLILNNLQQLSFDKKNEIFRIDEKNCDTLWISDGTPKYRGTQFENH
jgi:hypothetical protein